ncbi:acyl-homoserine-lactone synthase [Agrobacterium sp. CR_3]|uniref:acyl-homoserine-lactone synthase n=1 Tax=Agrobacterium sp. CR_3 TaxID=3055791 RepID=UPI0035C01EB8
MFLLIQPHQYDRYAGLLEQSFRLRKRVFHDRLGWLVDVHHGLERDAYDGLGPVYLVWCDEDEHHLYGTVRLMPTTGPTLLRDVFSRTLAGKDLVSPVAWEGTRMCLDVDLLRKLQPTLRAKTAIGIPIAYPAITHQSGPGAVPDAPVLLRVGRSNTDHRLGM